MGCTHFLPKIVGPQIASRMLLTGELISGEQAYKEGLVAAVDDDPVTAAMKMAQKMADQGITELVFFIQFFLFPLDFLLIKSFVMVLNNIAMVSFRASSRQDLRANPAKPG